MWNTRQRSTVFSRGVRFIYKLVLVAERELIIRHRLTDDSVMDERINPAISVESSGSIEVSAMKILFAKFLTLISFALMVGIE